MIRSSKRCPLKVKALREEIVSAAGNSREYVGEQDASELGPCILDPETRNIAQVEVKNRQEADKLFDILMGTAVAPRREWLLAHSEEANDNIW